MVALLVGCVGPSKSAGDWALRWFKGSAVYMGPSCLPSWQPYHHTKIELTPKYILNSCFSFFTVGLNVFHLKREYFLKSFVVHHVPWQQWCRKNTKCFSLCATIWMSIPFKRIVLIPNNPSQNHVAWQKWCRKTVFFSLCNNLCQSLIDWLQQSVPISQDCRPFLK